jgi:hypothetical protein
MARRDSEDHADDGVCPIRAVQTGLENPEPFEHSELGHVITPKPGAIRYKEENLDSYLERANEACCS